MATLLLRSFNKLSFKFPSQIVLLFGTMKLPFSPSQLPLSVHLPLIYRPTESPTPTASTTSFSQQ
jgi:hypothetical protein